jgi:hypothetical protein
MALFEGDAVSPADAWNQEATSRALDDLFRHTQQYKSSQDYYDLMRFIGQFRLYAPFNAMLVHVQMPGATYVAPPHRWLREFGRRVKVGARPLVILQPKGPVMFVFDVSDTEGLEGALPLPTQIVAPFEVRHGCIGAELGMTTRNAVRDGVNITERQAGAQSAGEISTVHTGGLLRFQTAIRPKPKWVKVPHRYEVLLNAKHSPEAKYATLTHELAHLYCGHLGTPDPTWWPDRRGLSEGTREFEAESVCYLLCSRLGIDNPSETYLAGYLEGNAETPPISLECVMRATGLIEQMGRVRMEPRKEGN